MIHGWSLHVQPSQLPSCGQISSHRPWANHYQLVSWSLPVVQSADHYLWPSQLIITCGPVSWSLPVVQLADHYLWSSQLITTCGPVSRSLPVVQSADHIFTCGPVSWSLPVVRSADPCLRRRDRKHCRLHQTGAADSSRPQDSPFHRLHHKDFFYFREWFGAAAYEQMGEKEDICGSI